MGNETNENDRDELILGHFTIIGISAVGCVACLIMIGTAIASWCDMRNYRHELPKEGEMKTFIKKGIKTRKKRRSSASTTNGSKESEDKQGSKEGIKEVLPSGPTPSCGTARLLSHRTQMSKRMTLSEKRKAMQYAAKTFSSSTTFFMDNTQTESESELAMKTANWIKSARKDNNYISDRLDNTQRSKTKAISILRTPKSNKPKSKASTRKTEKKSATKSSTSSSSSSKSSRDQSTNKSAIKGSLMSKTSNDKKNK